MLKCSVLLALFATILSAAPTVADVAAPPLNLLNLANGGVLVEAAADPVKALALTDGDPSSNWSASTKKIPAPQIFTFELIAPASLTEVGINGAGARPGGVQGGSARTVIVEASADEPETGFIEIARFQAAAEGDTLTNVSTNGAVQWLRFLLLDTQEPADWVYFSEVIAHGEMIPPDTADRFTGIFQTGRKDFIELAQEGTSVTGCFVENSGLSNGTVTGSVQNGVALLSWRNDKDITGTALLTRDHSGALTGVRYRQRSRSSWGGPVAPNDAATPCSEVSVSNPILSAIEAEGEARIYGIYFDVDSGVPKPSSASALAQLLDAMLTEQSLSLVIEGHTDSDGSDDYNLDLSARRAASVVGWLTQNGIASDRLRSEGLGESEPVASNKTADGKALNRRVDVVPF